MGVWVIYCKPHRRILTTAHPAGTNCLNIDNATEYSMTSGFVRMAMEEFYAHKTNNMTGLLVRYWDLVETELAGEYLFE